MAITEVELANKIEASFNRYSNVEVEPAVARRKQAEEIAEAIALYVVGRTTTVTGTSATGGPVTGTGVIKGDV